MDGQEGGRRYGRATAPDPGLLTDSLLPCRSTELVRYMSQCSTIRFIMTLFYLERLTSLISHSDLYSGLAIQGHLPDSKHITNHHWFHHYVYLCALTDCRSRGQQRTAVGSGSVSVLLPPSTHNPPQATWGHPTLT